MFHVKQGLSRISPPAEPLRRRRKSSAPIDAAIGAKLTMMRRHRCLTLDGMGKAMGGLSYHCIRKIELGDNRVTCDFILKAAAVLGVKPEWFLEGLADGSASTPLIDDALARKLGEAFAKIEDDALRKLVVSFVDGISRGVFAVKWPAQQPAFTLIEGGQV